MQPQGIGSHELTRTKSWLSEQSLQEESSVRSAKGLLAAAQVLYSSKLPYTEQFKAVVWLAVLTLPVFAAAAIGIYCVGKTASGAVLAAAAVGAIAGCAAMGALGVPKKLGNVYCFNDGRLLEHECRDFDSKGFANAASQPGTSSSKVLSLAFS